MGVGRRAFLKGAAALAAAPRVVRSTVLGGGRGTAPSSRVTLGFIGVGMMGRGHLRCFLRYPGAQVLAVCDVDRWRREHALATAEQAAAGQATGGGQPGCRAYTDLRRLLDRGDVDAVVIATGDRWHALATCLAAKAGKDVYCEKPVSLTIDDSLAMVAAVRRYGRVFQSGLQQRSSPVFRRACELVRSGGLGRVRVVYVAFPGASGDVSLPPEPVPPGLDWDLWLGPAPWRPFNRRFHHYGQPQRVVPWDFCRDFGGGNLTSNAVHAFDTVQWGLGMDDSGPVEIVPPGAGRSPCLTYRYAGGVLLQVVPWHLDRRQHFVPKGWDPHTRLQNFGALFVGQRGWVHVGRSGYLQAFPAGILERDSAGPGQPHHIDNHHLNWLACVRTRRRPACDVAVGCRSTTVSHLGCIAHWTGRAQRWDPARQAFLGDEEASRLRARAYREPWRL